jgi:hypothetical protein
LNGFEVHTVGAADEEAELLGVAEAVLEAFGVLDVFGVLEAFGVLDGLTGALPAVSGRSKASFGLAGEVLLVVAGVVAPVDEAALGAVVVVPESPAVEVTHWITVAGMTTPRKLS